MVRLVLIPTLTTILVGALLASAVINVTSGGSGSALSQTGTAVATRSLPPYWVVRPGDTFDSIAGRNHLSASRLQLLNPLQDPTTLLPGQHLRLRVQPRVSHVVRSVPPRSWIVRRGDTYSSIAARNRLLPSDIAQLNPAVNPAALVPGQRLELRR